MTHHLYSRDGTRIKSGAWAGIHGEVRAARKAADAYDRETYSLVSNAFIRGKDHEEVKAERARNRPDQPYSANY